MRRFVPALALFVTCAAPALGQGISGALGGGSATTSVRQQVTVVPFPGNLYAPSNALSRLGVAVAQAPVSQPTGRAPTRVLRRIAIEAGEFMVPGVAGVPMTITRITDRDALRPSLRKVNAEGEVDRLWSTIEGFRGTNGAVYTARYIGQDHMYSAWVEGTLVIVQQEQTGAFLVFHVQEYGE